MGNWEEREAGGFSRPQAPRQKRLTVKKGRNGFMVIMVTGFEVIVPGVVEKIQINILKIIRRMAKWFFR